MKATKCKWTPVSKELPLKDVSVATCGEFLVTVELKDANPNDEPEVMVLWFDTKIQDFVWSPGGKTYSLYHSWHVTHWAPMPKAAPRIKTHTH